MIAFPRRVARRFRAACARCTSGRPRGPAPCVVLRQADGRVTLTATFPEVTLELAYAAPPAPGRAEVLIVPLTALETVGASSDEAVEFDAGEGLTGGARWAGPGGPGSVPVTYVLPGKQHEPLPRPEMKTVPAGLLVALHEAGRTSSREDGRYALSRVQVLGATGRIVATDGKLAVVFGPFALPFTGDVLIPAVPLFGSPEVRTERDVRVGCTDAHVVLAAGDWTAWLGVAPGKFPDVAAVIPRHAPTTVALDRDDAADLLPQLPGLPGQGHDLRPVTLCANGALAVRAGDEAGTVKEVRLARSPVTGPAARVVLDRRALARILALGCTALRISPDKALVGTGDGVTVLAALLDPELAVAPEPRAPGRNAHTPIPDPNTNPKRSTIVKPNDTNGHAHGSRHDPPAGDAPDPLVAAEELRAALADAATKAARLVAALKMSRKEQKVLASVLANLKQLNLGTGEPR